MLGHQQKLEKLANVLREMEKRKIKTLVMSEKRWKGSDKVTTDKYIIIHSGGDNHDNGVGLLF